MCSYVQLHQLATLFEMEVWSSHLNRYS